MSPPKPRKLAILLVRSFEQVWFPGVHADVGGGYEDTSLADIALSWMVRKALRAEHPLWLDQDPRLHLRPSPAGKLHDSREGFWRRLLYREVWRSVCKGHQEPLSKVTEKTGEAFLHSSWLARSVPSTRTTGHLTSAAIPTTSERWISWSEGSDLRRVGGC
jgi:hypothetical protein